MVTTRRGTRLKNETKRTGDGEDISKPTRSSPEAESDTDLLVEKIFTRMKRSNPSDRSSLVQASGGPSCSEQPDLLRFESPSTSQEPSASCPSELSSSLQPQLNERLYFSYDPITADNKDTVMCENTLCRGEVDSLMKRSVVTSDFEKKECAPPITRSRLSLEKSKKAARLQSAGKEWFDMPAPQLTPELKNDLKLLRMRNALDPSKHYKANDTKQLPRYFQVGRVMSDASEFYSSRIPRKQQKQTLVDELLSNEVTRQYQKKKYLDLQKKFSSGTKRLKNIKHRKKYKTF